MTSMVTLCGSRRVSETMGQRIPQQKLDRSIRISGIGFFETMGRLPEVAEAMGQNTRSSSPKNVDQNPDVARRQFPEEMGKREEVHLSRSSSLAPLSSRTSRVSQTPLVKRSQTGFPEATLVLQTGKSKNLGSHQSSESISSSQKLARFQEIRSGFALGLELSFSKEQLGIFLESSGSISQNLAFPESQKAQFSQLVFF